MKTTMFADLIVNFDRDTNKHICRQTTEAVNRSPLPVRLLFPDRAAFLQQRRPDGGIRVAFVDRDRTVHGILQADDINQLPEGSATDKDRNDNDMVILKRPILYGDVEDVIRAVKAGQKQG
jgi:hypothetical protein